MFWWVILRVLEGQWIIFIVSWTSPKNLKNGPKERWHSPWSWQVASRWLFGWFQLGQITAYDVKNKQTIGQNLPWLWICVGLFLVFSTYSKILFPKYSSFLVALHAGVVNHWRNHSGVFIWLSGAWEKTFKKNAGNNDEIPTLKQMVVFPNHWMGRGNQSGGEKLHIFLSS